VGCEDAGQNKKRLITPFLFGATAAAYTKNNGIGAEISRMPFALRHRIKSVDQAEAIAGECI